MPHPLLDPTHVPKNSVLRTLGVIILIPALIIICLIWVALTYVRVLAVLVRIVQGKIQGVEPHGWPLD